MKRAVDRVLQSMSSERPCRRCGCVKARHPARYCTFHGPEYCRRYLVTPTSMEMALWAAALAVWFVALLIYVKQHPWP